MPSKAKLSAYDAFALLDNKLLYPEQLSDILNDELEAEKILCISDTVDVMLHPDDPKPPIAHSIENANLGPRIEVTQSDYIDPADEKSEDIFGTHLPQNQFQTRREYKKIDATRLEEDLPDSGGEFDMILGRGCICACNGDGVLCGGISMSKEGQQSYLKSLLQQKPDLLVLSASGKFCDTPEEKQEYLLAKRNLIELCEDLNQASSADYQFMVIEPDEKVASISELPQVENGYLLVVYSKEKIDFDCSTRNLQQDRLAVKKQLARDRTSVQTLIEMRGKILSKEVKEDIASPPPPQKKR